jgi:hypothetical protein
VGGGYGLDDGEPETVAGLVVTPSWFETLEGEEESFHFGGGDHRSVVGHGQDRFPCVGCSRDMDFAADSVVEHRVVNEVLDELFDEPGVAFGDCWRDVGRDV